VRAPRSEPVCSPAATCFDRYVVVDWSASGRPTSGPDSIWVASADARGHVSCDNLSTRAHATSWLRAHLVAAADRGERVLLGIDAALGYPAGFARAVGIDGTERPWRAVWNLIASLVYDDEANANNRFDVAGFLNRRTGADCGPFWGNGLRREVAGLARTRGAYPCAGLAEYRTTERRIAAARRRPQPVWKLSGAGSVGGQTLTLLPWLARLVDDPRLAGHTRVWPFETGFGDDPCAGHAPALVVAEVWPSLVDAARIAAVDRPVKDARQVVALADELRTLDSVGALGACFADPGLDDATCSLVLRDEGWILTLAP